MFYIFTEAVFARTISAIKEERVAASKKIKGPDYLPVKGHNLMYIG